MTDYLGMRYRLWQAIWENAGEAIDKVLDEVWRDGYNHGLEAKLDKEETEVEDDNRRQGIP